MTKFLLAFLVPFLILPQQIFGALANTVVWEIRPTNGVDTNGGGFDPAVGSPGTDFSQQGAAQIAFTDLVVGVTTTEVTSVLHPFGATFPGNTIQIVSGTGCTTGIFEILSVSSITATLDRSAGTAASACTANLGGSHKTLAQLDLDMANCGAAWVKAEATITTAVQNLLDYNCNANTNKSTQISGYTTSRGDAGKVAVQQSGDISFGNPIIFIQNNAGGLTFRNFILDCNGKTSSRGLGIQGQTGSNRGENIKVMNCTAVGVQFNNNMHVCFNCWVTASAGTAAFYMNQGNGPNFCINCTASANTTIGFYGYSMVCIRCIAANNSGGSSDGYQIIQNNDTWYTYIEGSIAYGNGRDGMRMAPGQPVSIINSVFYGNAGVGINDVTGPVPANGYALNWNALGANGTARTNVSAGANDVTLSGDPFTNGGSLDFSLNNTVGAGAALKAAGFPGVLQSGGTGFMDIGTLQAAAGASSLTVGTPIQ